MVKINKPKKRVYKFHVTITTWDDPDIINDIEMEMILSEYFKEPKCKVQVKDLVHQWTREQFINGRFVKVPK